MLKFYLPRFIFAFFSSCSTAPMGHEFYLKARKRSLVFVEISSYTQTVGIICIELNRFLCWQGEEKNKSFQFKCSQRKHKKESEELTSYIICAFRSTQSLYRRRKKATLNLNILAIYSEFSLLIELH